MSLKYYHSVLSFSEIEVYQYPEDTTPSELIFHFQNLFQAHCLTPEDCLLNQKSDTYVMKFQKSGSYSYDFEYSYITTILQRII